MAANTDPMAALYNAQDMRRPMVARDYYICAIILARTIAGKPELTIEELKKLAEDILTKLK